MDPDDVGRIIMLLYGRMDHGGPFWCSVAIKPSRFDDFKVVEQGGMVDLYDFDEFGEVIVSGEGVQPPDEVTRKVAELYGSDVDSFFKPIDPLDEISKKIAKLEEEEKEAAQGQDTSPPSPPPAAGGWAARISRKPPA
jgi:hypothetical protein